MSVNLLQVKEDMSLVEILQSFSKLAEVLAETGGEMTPEIEESLQALDLKTAGKIDAYHFLMKRMETDAEFWEAEAKRRQQIAAGCYALADRLKKGILYAMQQLGTNEIAGNAVRAKLSPTKGRLVIDEATLPDDWKMTEIRKIADKERIRAALENLETIPGASIEGGVSVRFYAAKPEKKKIGGKDE
jgi:hypothetical protein